MKLPYRLQVSNKRHLTQITVLLALFLQLGTYDIATASVIDSKHNLSASGPGLVKAVSETQVCVFCHTPHGADQSAGAPLWNRAQSTATYTPYLSSATDSNPTPGQPAASSKVCLSCHDGTMAIGMVINLRGKVGLIEMSGTGPGGVMPDNGTGYTSNLGTNLDNDHPISFVYDSTLANNDGELRTPPVTSGSATYVANRSFGVKPTYPLESSQIQCPTCHDPHLSTDTSPKFLRGLRLQKFTPLGGYTLSNDIMCLACHDKDNLVATWSHSAHANNNNVATETYTNAAATTLEFPLSPPTQVWQASCISCHDPHTVPGARRLLRDGTNGGVGFPKSGGSAASEQTCYQCHSAIGTRSILNQSTPTPDMVPDIEDDFLLSYRMPISDQPETHNTGGGFDDSTSVGGLASGTTGRCNTAGDQCGKDLMESEASLGKISRGGIPGNRHTECTDCHNPHRATKNRLFFTNAATPDVAGTHKHNIESGDTEPHSNVISGSLRGTFGVEPVYSANDFGTTGIPTSFDVKRGDPGLSSSTLSSETYVTREYQICLKCHSNYAFDYPEQLGYSGGTPWGINGFDTYLNTAMEFQAPLSHKGAPASTSDSGASSSYSANNYRSWHPVMDNTGRTVINRGNADRNLWRSPWNGSDVDGGALVISTEAVGNQTMYCSDCHGTVVSDSANGVVPDGNGSPGAWTENGKPWGPHGSSAYFILKGPSNTTSPVGVASDTLCFRCHDATQYADASGAPAAAMNSGFGGTGVDAAYGQPINNLHQRHAFYTTQGGVPHATASVWPASENGTYRCTMCHTGTAHGWKNKDFLVNLNDVGPEVNKTPINGTVGGALGGEIAPGPVTLNPGDPVPKGTQVPMAMAPVTTGYTNGPYYQGALLYVNSFKASGNWTKADCANSACH
jgi:hypothetical protein